MDVWALDQKIFHAIHVGWHSDFLDVVFYIVTCGGLDHILILSILTLYFWESKRRFILPLILSWAMSGLASVTFKSLFPRMRPSYLWYAQPSEWIFGRSFPSGHTTVVFGVAFMCFFLSKGTRWRKAGYFSLFWAFWVGISRIYRGVHWPTDVVGGIFAGLIGASLAYMLWQVIEQRSKAKPPEKHLSSSNAG